ncbi:MAG: hypothetical protein V1728_00080 [Candidatus Micrarchaeota archaeon]
MSMQNTVFAQNGRTPEQNNTITAHRKELMSRISSGLRMARTLKDQVTEKALNQLKQQAAALMYGPAIDYKTERNRLRVLNEEVKSIVALEKTIPVPAVRPASPGAVQTAVEEQYFNALKALQGMIDSAADPGIAKSLGALRVDIIQTKNIKNHEPDQQAVSTHLIGIVERAREITTPEDGIMGR